MDWTLRRVVEPTLENRRLRCEPRKYWLCRWIRYFASGRLRDPHCADRLPPTWLPRDWHFADSRRTSRRRINPHFEDPRCLDWRRESWQTLDRQTADRCPINRYSANRTLPGCSAVASRCVSARLAGTH